MCVECYSKIYYKEKKLDKTNMCELELIIFLSSPVKIKQILDYFGIQFRMF